jgi:hypothetical protein
MGPRAYACILFVLCAIAAVAFVNAPDGEGPAPANALIDQQDCSPNDRRRVDDLHQPTILRADPPTGLVSEPLAIEIPVRLSAESAGMDTEVHRVWKPTDLAPSEFLTIPGLEPPQRR